jgi:hypothetical protein
MSDTTTGYHNKFLLLRMLLFGSGGGNLRKLETCESESVGLQRRSESEGNYTISFGAEHY